MQSLPQAYCLPEGGTARRQARRPMPRPNRQTQLAPARSVTTCLSPPNQSDRPCPSWNSWRRLLRSKRNRGFHRHGPQESQEGFAGHPPHARVHVCSHPCLSVVLFPTKRNLQIKPNTAFACNTHTQKQTQSKPIFWLRQSGCAKRPGTIPGRVEAIWKKSGLSQAPDRKLLGRCLFLGAVDCPQIFSAFPGGRYFGVEATYWKSFARRVASRPFLSRAIFKLNLLPPHAVPPALELAARALPGVENACPQCDRQRIDIERVGPADNAIPRLG